MEDNLRTAGNSNIKTSITGENMQSKILKELEYLKGDKTPLGRPGSSSEDVRKLRDERDYLASEN